MAVLLPLLFLASAVTVAQQQTCVSLAGSSICPAFNQSSVATDARLQGYYPFLVNVTSPQTFDTELQRFVNSTWAQRKYQDSNQFGCANVNLANTTSLYARFTYSYICNAIIQLSQQDCLPAGQAAPPALCSQTCTEFATSEGTILSSPSLCGTTGPNAMNQLRADVQQCLEPQASLAGACVYGYQNEGSNCGFQYNLEGLCEFCSRSSINSTDSCCRTSQAETRCANVTLPTYSSMTLPFTTTATVEPTSTGQPDVAAAASTSRSGLSGGAIAGIVIGSVAGAAILFGLILCCCLLARRRRRQREESSLNAPTPPMSRDRNKKGEKFAAPAGARVTRMSALEASSTNSVRNHGAEGSNYHTPTDGAKTPRSAAGFGAIAVSRRDKSVPRDALDESSPESQGYSSGDGAATGQSEQMDAFKDYYSNDDIHPGDTVSTLWAYSPRANDEFELERGDMLRVVGIWDDGWATGVRINERAEDWEPGHNPHRDSGVSGNGGAEQSPPARGEVKAFPHWKKTVEGDAIEPEMSDGGARTE